MTRILSILLGVLLVGAMSACDSGDIAERTLAVQEHGRTVKVTGHLKGLSELGQTGYRVAMAGFANGNRYAIVQRALQTAASDELAVNLVVDNLNSDVNTLELSLTTPLRERVVSLQRLDMDAYEGHSPSDTIYFDLGEVDMSLFGCLQAGVFDRACIQCHGGNGRKAANLDLTTGHAYANLVNVPSTRKEGVMRIQGGHAEHSLLRQILHEGGEQILHYNHTEVMSSLYKETQPDVHKLIDEWIKAQPEP